MQGGFEIVHWKIFVPNPSPVIVVFGWFELVIVPVPDINVHTPVPTVGVLAVIAVEFEVMQSVCVKPAFATLGISCTWITIVEDDAAQGEFEMVHSKIFVPDPRLVIVVLG